MPAITPFLWFDTQAEAAAQLYTSVFPKSEIHAVVRYPVDTPSGKAGDVMTVEISLDGNRMVLLNGGPHFRFTEAVSFVIHVDDQDELDHYWDRLTADGGEPGPCGWLKDRFGLSWQVVPRELDRLMTDPDPERARRASEAMLAMTKLDIAALRAAADGVTQPTG